MTLIRVLLCMTLLMNSTFANEKIAINRADAAQLASALSGVGEKKAQKIVAWRKQQGDFKRLEDLTQIPGLGSKWVERNQHLIDFTPSASLKSSGEKARSNDPVVAWPISGFSP